MKIIYTYTDEAPALATRSLLPIVEAFAGKAGVPVETRDISLAARILAQFPDRLGAAAVPDSLAELGSLAQTPEANIIKLPNVSASLPQLKAAIAELQQAGYDVPDYPESPSSAEEQAVPHRLRRGEGKRRESGAARGQFRPPGARLGEELREGPPALDGRVVTRVEVARVDHVRRRLPALRALGDAGQRRRPAYRTRRCGRHVTVLKPSAEGAGRRDRRCGSDEPVPRWWRSSMLSWQRQRRRACSSPCT